MTEAEWLKCTRPNPMLAFLRTSGFNRVTSGRRKLRLIGCGCARRVERHMTERGFRYVEFGERIADGTLPAKERMQVKSESFGPNDGQRVDHQADMAGYFTLATNVITAAEAAALAGAGCVEIATWHQQGDATADAAKIAEREAQTAIIRDIFGNPFRSVVFSPSWLTDTAVALARQMYESREFGAMPILADALQDAGCDNTDILSHCRETGATHVRGCWVVDLVLGKQ